MCCLINIYMYFCLNLNIKIMKREVKFRVWNEINEMLYPDGNGYFDDGKTFVIDGLGELIYLDNSDTPNGILMQFTGLKDKNGVDIYEGDIVVIVFEYESDDENFINPSVVIWSHISLRWDIPTYKDAEHGLPLNWNGYKSLEIIGNIYENPELLK